MLPAYLMTTSSTSSISTTTDPWQMQRALMAASDQHLPASPELNKGVVLYAALNLEELSETLKGLTSALNKVEDAPAGLGAIAALLGKVSTDMHLASVQARSVLEQVPNDFRAPVQREDLREMADGTTDVTVTNSGFALSLGLDGARCYEEVAQSNLSKANPDTGKIDKTPDGKWIKGRNYRGPDLDRVIFGD